MVDYVNTSLSRYFNTLSNTGYVSKSNTLKLFVYTMIYYLLENDFRGFITEADYNSIVKALYCLYGSTCLIGYPDYYNNKTRRVMYNGSTSELAYRVSKLEEEMTDASNRLGTAEEFIDDFHEMEDRPLIVPDEP